MICTATGGVGREMKCGELARYACLWLGGVRQACAPPVVKRKRKPPVMRPIKVFADKDISDAFAKNHRQSSVSNCGNFQLL